MKFYFYLAVVVGESPLKNLQAHLHAHFVAGPFGPFNAHHITRSLYKILPTAPSSHTTTQGKATQHTTTQDVHKGARASASNACATHHIREATHTDGGGGHNKHD